MEGGADVVGAGEAEACGDNTKHDGIRYGDKHNDGGDNSVNDNEHGGDHRKSRAGEVVQGDAEPLQGAVAGADVAVMADVVVAGQSQIVRQTVPGIC
jgi:hypothetical protein